MNVRALRLRPCDCVLGSIGWVQFRDRAGWISSASTTSVASASLTSVLRSALYTVWWRSKHKPSSTKYCELVPFRSELFLFSSKEAVHLSVCQELRPTPCAPFTLASIVLSSVIDPRGRVGAYEATDGSHDNHSELTCAGQLVWTEFVEKMKAKCKEIVWERMAAEKEVCWVLMCTPYTLSLNIFRSPADANVEGAGTSHLLRFLHGCCRHLLHAWLLQGKHRYEPPITFATSF